MAETLDVRRLLREEGVPAKGEGRFDLSEQDFVGFTVPQPVTMRWEAVAGGGVVRLHLWLQAELATECVRCLSPAVLPLAVEKEYAFEPGDLVGEYPEYPTAGDGVLDLFELAYGEVVMEGPVQPLCREDCEGLCSMCGSLKANCRCEEEAPAEADPRWAALRALLEEESPE